MYPRNSEDDDPLMPLQRRDKSTGRRLRRFHDQFDSSIRAILRDCLFREIEDDDATVTLQILCPNQAVQKRLIQKRQKIGNEIRWIWLGNVDKFALCVEYGGELQSRTYSIESYFVQDVTEV